MEVDVECPQDGTRMRIRFINLGREVKIAFCDTCRTWWVAKIVTTVAVESLTEHGEYTKQEERRANDASVQGGEGPTS